MGKSAKQQIREARKRLQHERVLQTFKDAGLPEPLAEYKFAQQSIYARQWQADYALVDVQILVEIEGGVWIGGRHNRPQGYLEDVEKYNAAAVLGYLLLRFPVEDIGTNYMIDTLQLAVQMQKQRLGMADYKPNL